MERSTEYTSSEFKDIVLSMGFEEITPAAFLMDRRYVLIADWVTAMSVRWILPSTIMGGWWVSTLDMFSQSWRCETIDCPLGGKWLEQALMIPDRSGRIKTNVEWFSKPCGIWDRHPYNGYPARVGDPRSITRIIMPNMTIEDMFNPKELPQGKSSSFRLEEENSFLKKQLERVANMSPADKAAFAMGRVNITEQLELQVQRRAAEIADRAYVSEIGWWSDGDETYPIKKVIPKPKQASDPDQVPRRRFSLKME